MAAWIKKSLGMEVGLSPGDFVLDGDPAHPFPKAPKFSAHVYCGQFLARCVLGRHGAKPYTLYNSAVRVKWLPLTNQWLPGPSLAMAVQGLCIHSGCLGVDFGNGSFFMELVPQRYSATLIPIIQCVMILPGTTVWSDQWAAYNELNALGYVHQTVNHSQHYADLATSIHTNNIEACWAACKASFKR